MEVVLISAETGRTRFWFDALVFQLLRLPLEKFRFHAFVELFSVLAALSWS